MSVQYLAELPAEIWVGRGNALGRHAHQQRLVPQHRPPALEGFHRVLEHVRLNGARAAARATPSSSRMRLRRSVIMLAHQSGEGSSSIATPVCPGSGRVLPADDRFLGPEKRRSHPKGTIGIAGESDLLEQSDPSSAHGLAASPAARTIQESRREQHGRVVPYLTVTGHADRELQRAHRGRIIKAVPQDEQPCPFIGGSRAQLTGAGASSTRRA